MPDPTTIERLRGLVLSANDLSSLTEWPDALIEDYLNIVDNLITISNLLDVQIDQKIEEIPTAFTDGSVPFADTQLLIEDNTNFIFNNVTKVLTLGGALLKNLTASRLTASDANKNIVSVVNLASWIAGVANQILITNDGDGSITISIPDTNVTGAELETLSDNSMADTLHRHSELSASDGDPDACLAVGVGGAIILTGGARVVKEVKLSVESFAPGASGATQTLIGHYSGWAFTINDDMVTSFEIPFDWDSSTNLEVKIYWYINEAYITNSGEVQWKVDWAATPSDNTEAIDAPTHTGTIDYGDQDIPANAKYLTKSAAGVIAAASIAEGDLIGISISRIALDAGANPAAEPVLVRFEVEYTANRFGEPT